MPKLENVGIVRGSDGVKVLLRRAKDCAILYVHDTNDAKGTAIFLSDKAIAKILRLLRKPR